MAEGFGLVHLYYGDGKGKTTAAMGLALRALGRGYPVVIVQFLKRGDSGEIQALRHFERVTALAYPQLPGFSMRMTPEQKAACWKAHMELFQQAQQLCRQSPQGLLVLDEAVGACRKGLLDEQALLSFLDRRPAGWEIVLTGRDPSAQMLARADYATQMKKEKHPFDRGLAARDGIER